MTVRARGVERDKDRGTGVEGMLIERSLRSSSIAAKRYYTSRNPGIEVWKECPSSTFGLEGHYYLITKVKACGGEMIGNERVMGADQPRKRGSIPGIDLT